MRGITLIHNIPGRLRIRVSDSPANAKLFIGKIMGHAGLRKISYNTISLSVLVFYNPSQISATEILLRVAISYSLQCGSERVYLRSAFAQIKLGKLDYYALFAILGAWLSKYSVHNIKMNHIAQSNAAIATIAAVSHHGYKEMHKNGMYDPEVFSIIYLLQAIIKKDFIFAATLTWLATFWRHFFVTNTEKCYIGVEEVTVDKGRNYYDVKVVNAVFQEKNATNSMSLFVQNIAKIAGISRSRNDYSMFDNIKNVSKQHGNILEGMGNITGPIFMRLEL